MVDRLCNDYIRRDRICAEWERDHGYTLTALKHMRAVLQWLDRHRPDIALALSEAGYGEAALARIAEIQPDARERGKRAAFKTRDLHAIVRAYWRATTTADGFAAALARHDLRLAMGMSVPVAVGEAGKICREAKAASHPEDLARLLNDPAWWFTHIGLEA
jgi:hypothetical protein